MIDYPMMLDEFRIDRQPRSTLPYPLHRSAVLRFIERVIARHVAKAQSEGQRPPAVQPRGEGRIRPGLMFLCE